MMQPVTPHFIREMRTIMATDNVEWFEDWENVTTLLRWLHDNGEIAMEIDEVCYFLSKPWKWGPQYERMLAERAASATVDLTAVLLRQG